MGRTIVVVGVGTASGPADRCRLMIGLNAVADTPASALDEAVRLAKAVIQVLRDWDIPTEDIQTLNMTVQDWFDEDGKRVSGRVASYTLAVTARRIDDAGPLLAALAPVGGDALRLHGIGMHLADIAPLQQVARQRAMEDAHNRAMQLAEAAGLRLGPVVSIEEGSTPGHIPVARRSAASVVAESAPVEPGSHQVSVSVLVTYEIATAT